MSLNPQEYPRGFQSQVAGSSSAHDLVRLELAYSASTTAPVFVLKLLSAQTPDNRLTPQLLTALLAALQHVEDTWDSILSSTTHGAALVITGTTEGKTSKFFSNGLDFESAIADPNFFDNYLFPVYEKMLTFPIPTVASIGGHAFAAGWGLVSSCDGAVMGQKGYLCMNEVLFGAAIPLGLWAPLSTRIHTPAQKSRVVLQAQRWSGSSALQEGFIDVHVPEADSAAVLSKSIELAAAWAEKSKANAWGSNKVSSLCTMSVALSLTY